MKKSLFALAALGAFASAAQAQSSVTLFGALDGSLAMGQNISKVTSASTASVTSATSGGSGMYMLDSSIVSSNWGMRGSEDLGGGKKANFYVEGDLALNNGNTHSDGLFRRGANISLSDANLGEVFLGRRGSAYILATGQMLPVSGNTAHQWRTVIGSSLGDQISNSVTYASPTIMGTNVVAQFGMNNTVNVGDEGTAFAAHIINKSISGLQITAAYNMRKMPNTGTCTAVTAAGGTNACYAVAVPNGGYAGAANTSGNLEGYAVGLKYKVTPALEAGILYAHGRTNNGGTSNLNPSDTGATNNVGTANGQTSAIMGGGVGYQYSSNLLLGANYLKTTFESSMTNLQAHYMLSKRTTVYSQVTVTTAAKGNIQDGTGAANSFSPLSCGSNKNQVCSGGFATSAGAQNVPLGGQAAQVGMIHRF